MRMTPLAYSAMYALLSGCPRPAPPINPVTHLGPALAVRDAEDLLQRTLAVNDGYGTLRTVHQVTLEIALGGQRSEKRSFRAALAVRRPGHFRLNVLGPMGLKLIDLLYSTGKTKVLYLAAELQRSSRMPEILDSMAGDIAAVFRLDPRLYPSRRRLEETVALASGRAPLYELKEYRGGEIARQMTIFAATLAIARMETTDEQGEIRTITYGDHEQRGKLLVPRSIHVAREGASFYWLAIHVESVDVDVDLDDHLFSGE
jgi:outer membrane lipoprotein-sorting protein